MRRLIALPVLVGLWWLAALAAGSRRYILPDPWEVATAWWQRADVILFHAGVTGVEILLGLLCGALLGVLTALALAGLPTTRRWLLPLLVVSQAIPVFALAPILVLWLGYGLASKVAMSTLIIYFPVATAFYDGLRRTDPGWLDLGRSLGASRRSLLWQVRLPAALPALASGLRVGAGVAPIGAVIGEWVGSSQGLGYLMLQANARMQVPLMFACLLTLCLLAVTIYSAVDGLSRRLLPWQPDSLPAHD